MSTQPSEFAICIANTGYEDLDIRKVYRLLPDPKAEEVDCLRVVDESGEDYLYPMSLFVQVSFSEEVRSQLLATVGKEPE